jgi:hypothetical protein
VATCFVIMPISTFKPALERAHYDLIPPTAAGADIIHASIIKNLEEADLVLCDISTLNPNVFFELGIRTSLDRPAALVRDNFTSQIPFDTSSINTHTYDASLALWSVDAEVAKLTAYITEAVNQAGDRNSMWRVFGITQRAKPAEIENPTDEKLGLLMAQVTQLAKQVEGISLAGYGSVYGTTTSDKYGSIPVYGNYGSIPAYGNQISSGTAYTYITNDPNSSLINPIPSRFDNFITRAKAIALTESASLTVDGYDATDDAVVLSSGGWQLASDNVRKIDNLAGALKVKFRLLMTPR